MTDRLLWHNYREGIQHSTEIVMDDETGLPVIVSSQNVIPILEANKRASNDYDRHAPNPDGWTRVARIPVVIVNHLKRIGIWNDEKAMNAWLDNPQHRHLRTDGGRRLS